ncbi:MAG: GTPase HflX [Candidatus Thermoplasmatota archaeon]|nr:GTPase HflX [Candidatus Thermoplasmatota archaeon]
MSGKNAVIVSLSDDVQEIIQLADTLGYNVVKTFIQHKKTPDTNYYVGPGKVDEIKKFLEEQGEDSVNLVIVDGELKPSQWFALEKKLKIDVYDRIRLILAIFAERADSKEAKLQVRLAQLQYERPFVRELIHRARAGEHPGFMAGGEYQVDDYYEMIKKQMKNIREDLEKIRDEREIRRRHRHTSGFYLVSLAGYTNAGKSSLLNLLADEKVKVDGKLFSTLSTTTRKINDRFLPILLTDTVGFIKNLPTWVIDAFHSTLEELSLADVVLLVVDASESKEVIEKKLRVSIDELLEIGVVSPVIIVFNKIDLLNKEELESRVDYLRVAGLLENKKIVSISVKNKENVDMLLDMIHDSLPRISSLKLRLPVNEKTQSFISWMYEKARVYDVVYNDYITVSVDCNIEIKDKILSRCNELDGQIL